jgi:hypothetical protein
MLNYQRLMMLSANPFFGESRMMLGWPYLNKNLICMKIYHARRSQLPNFWDENTNWIPTTWYGDMDSSENRLQQYISCIKTYYKTKYTKLQFWSIRIFGQTHTRCCWWVFLVIWTHTHTWQKWELMANALGSLHNPSYVWGRTQVPWICSWVLSTDQSSFYSPNWNWMIWVSQLVLTAQNPLALKSSPLFHSPVPHLLRFYPWFWADWHSQSLFFSTYIYICSPCLRAQPSESCKDNICSRFLGWSTN